MLSTVSLMRALVGGEPMRFKMCTSSFAFKKPSRLTELYRMGR